MKDSDQSAVGQANGESEVAVEQPDGESEAEVVSNPDMNEIKVVIFLKDGRGYMGIGVSECDPILTPLEGDLAAALERVPELVQQARAKWTENTRYPKADLPKPSTPEPRQTTPGRQPAKAKTAQPAMF